MWRLFKKRQEDDLRRLTSAYRFLLKVSQSQTDDLEPWRGAFGQAYQQLFRDWPSPNESRRFEKKMLHRLKRTIDLPRAFILAVNDYLDQKPLSPEELDEVIERGREAYDRNAGAYGGTPATR